MPDSDFGCGVAVRLDERMVGVFLEEGGERSVQVMVADPPPMAEAMIQKVSAVVAVVCDGWRRRSCAFDSIRAKKGPHFWRQGRYRTVQGIQWGRLYRSQITGWASTAFSFLVLSFDNNTAVFIGFGHSLLELVDCSK